MKSCPSCNLKYADDTLQFCLNDGTELLIFSSELDESPTIFARATKTAERSATGTSSFNVNSSSQTLNWGEISNLEAMQPNATTALATDDKPLETAANKLYHQVLTIAPITVALMQNYWQWLYMDKPNAFEFPNFLWSINFLVWLSLLVVAGWLCYQAIQKNKGKGYAIIGFVILAINLLLTIVPRRF